MKKSSVKARKSLKAIRKLYGRQKLHSYLESIFTAALASPEADHWPRHQRAETMALFCKLNQALS